VFNLLVKQNPWGDSRDSMPVGRMLGYTEDSIQERFASGWKFDFDALIKLPSQHRGDCKAGHAEDFLSSEFDERKKGWRRCECAIMASGTLQKRYKRQSTGRWDWDAARAIVDGSAIDMECHGDILRYRTRKTLNIFKSFRIFGGGGGSRTRVRNRCQPGGFMLCPIPHVFASYAQNGQDAHEASPMISRKTTRTEPLTPAC